MLRLIFWRLVQLPLILLVIFVATFSLVWITPGDPLVNSDGARPSEEVLRARRRELHLDSPWSFASHYLWNLVTEGDLGPSLHYGQVRVSDILMQGLPTSAMLGAAALVVALLLGTAAGVIGALRPGTPLDTASLAVALVGVSLPNFVTGSLLLVVFAGLIPLLPVGGWGGIEHLILPAITLGIIPAAYIARLVRLGLADTMSSDFIRTARAKGLSRHRALFRHALKVAYLPVLSFLGPAGAAVLTGSFVVEKVFNIAGLGQHFVEAVLNKDKFLILGVVLTYSVILVLFNLLVDVAYAWIDPRIELA